MACLSPILIHHADGRKTWDEKTKRFGTLRYVSCGQCRSCRFMRSRQAALRCDLEATQHKANAFIDLTYRPEDLPEGGTLVKKHLQDFIKRFRASLEHYEPGKKIRYYACGEYGDLNGRPHYHVIIFGYDFPDKEYFKTSDSDNKIYRSAFLENCWHFGYSDVMDVDVQSLAYATQYIRKKITGEAADKHYNGRLPEFALMSTVPGLGAGWYYANKHWLWDEDRILMAGNPYRPPRFFEKLLEREDPLRFVQFQKQKSERLPFTQLHNVNQAEELPDDED